MVRLYVLAGFILVFLKMQLDGDLNKYINTKYAYLSVSSIVLLILLFIFEAVRFYAKERESGHKEKSSLPLQQQNGNSQENPTNAVQVPSLHEQQHGHQEYEHEHAHRHSHVHQSHEAHSHASHEGHSHGSSSRILRLLTYTVLIFPVVTGLFLPVETLDSSFVKAKGFSFPAIDVSNDNPGYHQFLKPDTSVFYGKSGYKTVSQKELAGFEDQPQLNLNDTNYLSGLEALYNYPDKFADKTISFKGFIYKGEQTREQNYFVFRFGFIHCVADSGVFGMLVEFPKDTTLQDDQWVQVTGSLTSELYQPFKQTLPVLKVESWKTIDAPSDPYVYRTF
ncbi:TIGR03943 family putative permease subunit [Paenibacillus physcomitrellae]|uniref:UPF0703 protein YcgQ n=1 Tax=Paenibacillus physcomitrellae TaxID=1619311 RepID=A0ABQ1GPW5_9BACL|nr:TIGR03943 family protein [Paenibacillus physcomitrellae]GGA47791.1 UPF0703 protein YcgQ [Paenibacillus physcomitrellae]